MMLIHLETVPVAHVRLLDGRFRDRQIINEKFLRAVDADRPLAGFRAQAGLPAKAGRYGGWGEASDITGHSLGHYLSAMAPDACLW